MSRSLTPEPAALAPLAGTATGPLTDFDPDDWFTPTEPPFKRPGAHKRQAKPKRLKQILSAEDYQDLPAST